VNVPKDYQDCYEYLSAQFEEVGGYEFYAELFPDIESSGESGYGGLQGNAGVYHFTGASAL